MTGDIRPIVIDAVARFGANQPIFSVFTFAEAMWSAFELKAWPEEGWCRDVLAKLDYVSPSQGSTLWVYSSGGWNFLTARWEG